MSVGMFASYLNRYFVNAVNIPPFCVNNISHSLVPLTRTGMSLPGIYVYYQIYRGMRISIFIDQKLF